MSAARMWVRLDLRRRARSLLVLAVLVMATTAVVLTAVAGARRGDSAVDRLTAVTKPATIAVLPNQPGFDWDAVRAIDGVETVGLFPLAPYVIDGLPPESDATGFAFDSEVMHSIEEPVVLEGRVADPARDDEGVITAKFEENYGKGVGDHVTLRLFSPEQIDLAFSPEEPDPGEPEGPAIDVEIVGVVRSGWFSDFGDVSNGAFTPSPALFEQHRANLLGANESAWVNALIRLEDGGDGIPAFREQLAEVSGRTDIEFFDLADDAQQVKDVARFEANALLAFAAAAAIASLFLVGQSVVRYVAGATAELEVLRAVGSPPRQLRWMAAAGPAVAASVGGLGGIAIAVAASSRFPIGTVAPLEPAPGTRVDLPVLVIGYLVVVGLAVGGALAASWFAARSYGMVRTARTSRVAGLVGRLGAPVPTAIGARFALERGSGPQSVPVLPAVVGAVVGVLGIVGALTFADGIDDATSNPARFGVFAELEAYVGFNGEDGVPIEPVLQQIAADRDVVAVNDDRSAVGQVGSVDLALFTLDPVDEAPPIVVLEGSLPGSSDEVALAPSTAKDAGLEVGERFELTGAVATVPMTVSGLAFVPEGPHNGYDTGAWVTPDGFDQLSDTFKFHFIDVTVRDGVEVDTVLDRVNREVAAGLGAPEGTELLEARVPPSRIAELKELSRLPLFLASFLGLLAVAAVGHAVATAVRRRRHDLAVLRAIGLTRGQSRRIALVQATVLALVGVVLGVPLGVALGRSLWRSVAESTPVFHVAPLAVLTLVVIAPAALLVANLLAAGPSQRAANTRVGHVLRTE